MTIRVSVKEIESFLKDLFMEVDLWSKNTRFELTIVNNTVFICIYCIEEHISGSNRHLACIRHIVNNCGMELFSADCSWVIFVYRIKLIHELL